MGIGVPLLRVPGILVDALFVFSGFESFPVEDDPLQLGGSAFVPIRIFGSSKRATVKKKTGSLTFHEILDV